MTGGKYPTAKYLSKKTPQTRIDISWLLGTNVVVQIPRFDALLQQRSDSESRTSGTCTLFCLCSWRLPRPDSTKLSGNFSCHWFSLGPTAIVEPHSVPVQGNIQVTNTLVNASKRFFQKEQDLCTGITLTDFSGTLAEKQEALRILRPSIPTSDDIPVT